jgi:hypothetical protein
MTEPAHVSGLQDHLGYWLRYVSNQVSHGFSLKLAAREVTVAEWVMLRELYDQDAMAPSEPVAQASCVGYMVPLAGRRAVYYGRTGESYVEPFPAAA